MRANYRFCKSRLPAVLEVDVFEDGVKETHLRIHVNSVAFPAGYGLGSFLAAVFPNFNRVEPLIRRAKAVVTFLPEERVQSNRRR